MKSKKRTKRERLEILRDLLEYVILNGKSKQTNIMSSCNMMYKQFQKYFIPLVKKGFLVENIEERYSITKKGLKFYIEIIREIVVKESVFR